MAATTPARTAERPFRHAVLCVADETLRRQVDQAVRDAGYEVLAVVDRGIEVLPAVVDVAPGLVVLDITLVGTIGMRLFRMITMLEPEAAIVVLSPFDTIDVAAVEAGARAVIPLDDMRRLRGVLFELAAADAPR